MNEKKNGFLICYTKILCFQNYCRKAILTDAKRTARGTNERISNVKCATRIDCEIIIARRTRRVYN